MTPDEAVHALRPLADDVGPEADMAAIRKTEAVLLPTSHLRLLQALNGMTVYHGAFRLFGIGREPHLDLFGWNAPQTWKFAWDDRVEPFLAFGETGFGDQYAYRRDPEGGFFKEVYFLEGILLQPEVVADSFEAFLADELVRNANAPYDSFVVGAVQRGGTLAADQHWTYVPSLALGGAEALENIIELPAVTAMTFAGDIATALAAEPDATPTNIAPWTDEQGRARLKVTFGQ